MNTSWLNYIGPVLRYTVNGNHYPGWLEPDRIIYDHQLVLFLDGDTSMQIGSESYVCPHNSYIIIPPATVHRSEVTSTTHCTRHCILFDWIYSGLEHDRPMYSYLPDPVDNQLIRPTPRSVPSGIFHGRIPDAQCLSLYDDMHSCFHSDNVINHLRSRALLLDLLIRLLAGRHGTINQSAPDLATRIQQLLTPLALVAIADMPPLRETLEELNITYSYACRCFRQRFSTTPHAYIMSQRINLAQRRLLHEQTNVETVAHQSGFSSPQHFTRCFRQYCGYSPSEWRHQSNRQITRSPHNYQSKKTK